MDVVGAVVGVGVGAVVFWVVMAADAMSLVSASSREGSLRMLWFGWEFMQPNESIHPPFDPILLHHPHAHPPPKGKMPVSWSVRLWPCV